MRSEVHRQTGFFAKIGAWADIFQHSTHCSVVMIVMHMALAASKSFAAVLWKNSDKTADNYLFSSIIMQYSAEIGHSNSVAGQKT